jgi:hypothetical protein
VLVLWVAKAQPDLWVAKAQPEQWDSLAVLPQVAAKQEPYLLVPQLNVLRALLLELLELTLPPAD